MFLSGIVSVILLVIIECWPAISSTLRLHTKVSLPEQEADDADVAAERARVESLGNNDVVRAVGLTKVVIRY